MRLLVLAIVAVLASASFEPADVELKFIQWAQKFSKTYASMEESHLALANFKASLERVALRNDAARSRNSSRPAVFGLNQFSDMTPDQFRTKMLMPKREYPKVSAPTLKNKGVSVPASLDWRDQNAVTPVKNQEQCGSCWAFSATEAIESAWILSGKGTLNNTDLAPQQIVDCDINGGDEGCNGGFTPGAYQYVMGAGGLESESNYPYQGVGGQCEFSAKKIDASISGFQYATQDGDENAMVQSLVEWGPLSICVDASNWQDYQSGIMSDWDCCWFCQLDHCVQLVGYDNTGSEGYYLVRNSWTTQWGINGYIELEMGKNTCGLTSVPTWPTA